MKVFEGGSGALPFLHNTDTLCLNGLLIASASADIGLSFADNVEACAQDDLPKFSSISAKFLVGQQPVAFGDKHNPWLRALQAQPERGLPELYLVLELNQRTTHCQVYTM